VLVVGGLNPNGVVARRPDDQSPAMPSGHKPVGVDGHRRANYPGLAPRQPWAVATPHVIFTLALMERCRMALQVSLDLYKLLVANDLWSEICARSPAVCRRFLRSNLQRSAELVFSDYSLILAREGITMKMRLTAGLVECFVLI